MIKNNTFQEIADDLSHNLCISRHHQSCLLDPTTSKETASVKMDAFSHVKFLNFFQWHICTSLYWVCLYCFLSKKASKRAVVDSSHISLQSRVMPVLQSTCYTGLNVLDSEISFFVCIHSVF